MDIIKIDFNRENRFLTALALGNFDGVHIGHQELIKSFRDDHRQVSLFDFRESRENISKLLKRNNPYFYRY